MILLMGSILTQWQPEIGMEGDRLGVVAEESADSSDEDPEEMPPAV
jgi:hypothetical protein